MTDYTELKRLAEAATPQKFDTAEEKSGNGYIECPHCGGSGEVELEADYCNYDGVAIGVQFYGIGHEFGAAEAYYRAANPAAVLALIAENEALRKDAERWRFFSVLANDLQAFPHSWGQMTPEKMDYMCDEAMSAAMSKEPQP
ncbi:hypothetical protein [Pseudomonas sp. E102]|uniref:hypothetical protein n=1 Tax=Pseudomonas sp. E102 TaxID=181579 RepID=UPI0040461176